MIRIRAKRRVAGRARDDGRVQKGVYSLLLLSLLAIGMVGCARYRAPKETIPTAQEVTEAQTRELQQTAVREIARKAPRREGSYRIGLNDVIEIRVFGNPEWDRTTRVGADGLIRFPPLGVDSRRSVLLLF